MNSDIAALLKKAQENYMRFQDDYKRNQKLTLILSDCLYNLRRIRIAVSYRQISSLLSKEERSAIEEIQRMSGEVEESWKKIHEKHKSVSPLPKTAPPSDETHSGTSPILNL